MAEAGEVAMRARWKLVESDPFKLEWHRTIEPSRGYLRLCYDRSNRVFRAWVFCERYSIEFGTFLRHSPDNHDEHRRGKREATKLLKRLRSALAGVGEDECPF